MANQYNISKNKVKIKEVKKSRDFAKNCLSQSMAFPIVMYRCELNYKNDFLKIDDFGCEVFLENPWTARG